MPPDFCHDVADFAARYHQPPPRSVSRFARVIRPQNLPRGEGSRAGDGFTSWRRLLSRGRFRCAGQGGLRPVRHGWPGGHDLRFRTRRGGVFWRSKSSKLCAARAGKTAAKASKHSRASASCNRECRAISPDCSNRFKVPSATPARAARSACVKPRSTRRRYAACRRLSCISGAVRRLGIM